MELFEANTKSSSGISGVLNEYYETVKGIDTTTQDIFGEGNPSKLSMLQKAFLEYSSQTPEDLKMRSVDYTPSPEEIAEAMRQKEEVKAKWTNPDGSMKKGYMLTPNGKPTKLSEDQWLIVRTPNFKRWFGDWEKEAWAKAAMDFLEKTESVASLTGQEFQKDGVKLTDKVSAYFNSIGNVAHNEELGDVVLDLKGVEDSLGHGMGRLKAAAFMAVKDVIEKGFIFNRETNWKGRGWNTAVITAPIKIGTKNYICEVVVKKINNSQRFYLHEVETKETLGGVFKSVANNGNASQVSRLILGKHLAEVNGKVSKVVDENGEPLVVYHRSREAFNIFDEEKIGSASDWGVFGRGFYFSPSDMAQYGSVKYSVFLNIKNPMIIDRDNVGAIRDEVDADRGESFTKRIVEQGYDGVIYKDWEGISEIVALKSTQIKAATNRQELDFAKGMLSVPATDNVGTFSNSPDIRWREDTVLMPIDINVLVARNIDALMNAIRKSHKSILAKEAELEKKYPSDDENRNSKIQNDLRLYILENFSSELVPIAKLSDEDFKFYRKQFGIRDKFVYTSFGYAIEHYFNRHPDTPIENYLLLPDTIINPDGKKEVGKWVKNKLGEWIYDASQAFIKEYDKWHVSTIKVDAQITPSGKKLIAFKNFYEDIKNREPYKNKRTIEDFWKNALSSSDSSRRHANISHAQKSQPSDIASTSYSKNQEKNDIRELERQERGNNPLVWASIVLAKDVLNGRQITQARLEKLLPGYKLDGSKYEYVKDRAQKIAETCRAKYLNAKRDIDQSLQLAESDYYWNSEQMEKIYDSFRKDGEAYGEAKQKIIVYLRAQKDKKLKDVKGYEAEDFKHNLVDSILQAMETEPKPPARESAEGRMLSA